MSRFSIAWKHSRSHIMNPFDFTYKPPNANGGKSVTHNLIKYYCHSSCYYFPRVIDFLPTRFLSSTLWKINFDAIWKWRFHSTPPRDRLIEHETFPFSLYSWGSLLLLLLYFDIFLPSSLRRNKIIIKIMISTFLMLYVATEHKNIVMYVRRDLPPDPTWCSYNDGKIIVWMKKDERRKRSWSTRRICRETRLRSFHSPNFLRDDWEINKRRFLSGVALIKM